MNWALRRQIFYLAIVLAFFAIFGSLIIYPYFNKAPTCSDGSKNGTETGVDCGGSCARACTSQVDEISLLWSRSFRVVPGRYNAVAYLENQNKNTVVNKIHYKFRFADKDNIYIGSREGDTYVPPAGKFAVFEPAIAFDHSIPVYTTFSFTETPIWIQVPQDKINQLQVGVDQITLVNEDTSPKLSAVIKNNSLFQVPDINIIAILYNAEGNAINISRTYVNVLEKKSSADITFTWPEPFTEKVVTKEIIPIYNIFHTVLK